MKDGKQHRQSNWKRNASRLAVFLFVLYALADISVLQEYCGNETVGIPSYAQQVRAEKRKAEVAGDAQAALKSSDSLPQDQTPDSPESEESCFCCCSHILLGFSPLKSYSPVLFVEESASNFSLKHRQTSTHLRLVYQPPKLA